MRKLSMCLLGLAAIAQGRSLLVISIDGLDNRYLRDADKMSLKIPAIRRLMAEGAWANGVVGVMPSVTFPSHTTMVTGVPPHQHGIINNTDGNNVRYWYSRQIKVPVLWDAARAAGLKTGAVDW